MSVRGILVSSSRLARFASLAHLSFSTEFFNVGRCDEEADGGGGELEVRRIGGAGDGGLSKPSSPGLNMILQHSS